MVVLVIIASFWDSKVLFPTQGKQVSNGPLRGSKEPPKATLMVDPLEAKRLAAVEWKLLQERAAFQVSFTTLYLQVFLSGNLMTNRRTLA